MKRCPECRRDYYDDTLLYCLDDGNALLEGPASMEEPATAIIPPRDSKPGASCTDDNTKIFESGKDVRQANSKRGILLVLALALTLGVAGYAGYWLLSTQRIRDTKTSSDGIKSRRLTGEGRTSSAAISPDGKFLAYTSSQGDRNQLWVKQIHTNSTVELPSPSQGIFDLKFSPDGNFVFFTGSNAGELTATISRVPTLGGTATRVVADADSVSFSADGKQIVFRRVDLKKGESTLWVANSDGSSERLLSTLTGSRYFDPGFAFSADGREIIATTGDDSLLPQPHYYLSLISVTDGSIRELGTKKWKDLDGIVLADSGLVYVNAIEHQADAIHHIFEVQYPSGHVQQVTQNEANYTGLSRTADGSSLVTVEIDQQSGLWVAPVSKPEQAVEVLPARGQTRGVAWMPDNRIAYVSDQSGTFDLWVMNAEGRDARQVTHDGNRKMIAAVSPDGLSVYLVCFVGGKRICRAPLSGGDPKDVVDELPSYSIPDLSPDGNWLINAYVVGFGMAVHRVRSSGGEREVLPGTEGVMLVRYSPDGRSFAGSFLAGDSPTNPDIAIFQAEGGAPVKNFKKADGFVSGRLVWTPDGKSICYPIQKGETTDIWVQPITGGVPQKLAHFDRTPVSSFDFSKDGKWIVLERGEKIQNAVMITGFK